MECKFCGKETKLLKGVYVCDECSTVSFSKDIELKQKQKLITEYLNDIQEKVLEQKDYLHSIEQRHINGEKLTAEELEIRDNIYEFQSIRLDLETYIKNGFNLREKTCRNLLYRLLVLSEWLSNYFRRDA